jgi:hypothetical protein
MHGPQEGRRTDRPDLDLFRRQPSAGKPLASWLRATGFWTDRNNSSVFALGLGVGVHHWTPSLPLHSAGTSLKRRKIGLGVGTDGQTENRTVVEFGIEIETGMDNQTKRSEREYGQSDKTIRKRIWTIR